MNKFRFEKSNIENIPLYVQFYKTCFPHAKHLDDKYFKWLYADNPVGPMIGIDTYYGEQLIGRQDMIPCEYSLQGTKIKCVLSANTAAAPKFQGCGLSKIMFSKIYDLIASEGYEFIIGFSNAASTPINLHFGVQLVSPLEAAIGFGPLHHSGNNRNHNAFSRIWTPETLRWRINNPNNPIFLRKKECGLFAAYASARKFGLSAYAEVPAIDHFEFTSANTIQSCMPRVYVGLSGTQQLSNLYKSIPMKLRPSPLNFFIKSLKQSSFKLDKNDCYISFLDFDAF